MIRDTYQYWELWNKKNKNVENYFKEEFQEQIAPLVEAGDDLTPDDPDTVVGDDINEDRYLSTYVGTVMGITPSGKYYTAFANSNVSGKEAAIDQYFWELVDEALEEKGYWHEAGEGCSTDIYICKAYPGDKKQSVRNADFERILIEKIMPGLTPADYLTIPGIYEILAEYYNNDILEEYEKGDK